jgi:hypothetical protein
VPDIGRDHSYRQRQTIERPHQQLQPEPQSEARVRATIPPGDSNGNPVIHAVSFSVVPQLVDYGGWSLS